MANLVGPSNTEEILLDETIADTNDHISSTYVTPSRALKLVIFCYSASDDGTLSIERIDLNGNARELSSVSVSSDTLSATLYDYNPGKIRCKWTSATGASSVVLVEAKAMGHL